MKKICCIVPAMLAWILLTGATAGLQVSVQSDKLDISARDVSLVDVMAALDEQAEITFRVIGDAEIQQLKVWQEFRDLPLDKGIARLLRGLSYSVLSNEAGQPRKIIILGRDQRGGVNWKDAPHPLFGGDEAGDAGSQEPVSSSEVAATETAYLSEAVEDVLAQTVKAAQVARTPKARAEALRRLGDFQDSRTLEALQPALGAEETEVRLAALEAMRWGTVYESAALEEVRKLAEEDVDPQVKHSALEVVVRYDSSPEARALLERYARSGDEVLRSFASRELQRMDEEAAALAGYRTGDIEQQEVQEADEAAAAMEEEDAASLAEGSEQQGLQPEDEPVAPSEETENSP